MPKKHLPRILAVEATQKPYTLLIEWEQNHQKTLVNVSNILNNFKFYSPLKNSTALFKKVQVGELGADIVWSDELDMSADTLWRLAQEQSGLTMTPEAFKQWRVKQGYTLDEAALSLGISRRMIAYYEQGKRPIPRVVALATLALDNQKDWVFKNTG